MTIKLMWHLFDEKLDPCNYKKAKYVLLGSFDDGVIYDDRKILGTFIKAIKYDDKNKRYCVDFACDDDNKAVRDVFIEFEQKFNDEMEKQKKQTMQSLARYAESEGCSQSTFIDMLKDYIKDNEHVNKD